MTTSIRYRDRATKEFYMKKGKIYTSHAPENPPEWYWKSGLHDARIIKVEALEFPIDYSKMGRGREKQYRNMLSFKIDSSNALFDRDVKEIRFYNYTIISKEISFDDMNAIWWMSDTLINESGKYFLKIDMLDSSEDFTFTIKFEAAEVERK